MARIVLRADFSKLMINTSRLSLFLYADFMDLHNFRFDEIVGNICLIHFSNVKLNTNTCLVYFWKAHFDVALSVVEKGTVGDPKNKENQKKLQDTNLSVDIHCSGFPKEGILTTPHGSKRLHFNQCKNVTRFSGR